MDTNITLREALFIKSLSLVPKHEKIELLSHILKVKTQYIYFHLEDTLSVAQLSRYKDMGARLLANEPLQYVTNTAYFYGETFYVDNRVLIPRPETEVMVEEIIKNHPQSEIILDIGTGSGAISKALSVNLKNAKIYSLDICDKALEVAAKNLEDCQNVELIQSDLLENIPISEVDLICANLPYIGTEKFSGIDPKVAQFEPKKALFAGPDGLDLYRRLFTQILNKQIKFKSMYIELADSQAKSATQVVKLLLPQTQVQTIKDLNNKIRFLEIKPL